MVADFDDVVRRLRRLKHTDRNRTVFGASKHRYRQRTLGARAVAALEKQVGAQLPDDYRRWITHIGYGAGPNFGLLSPSDIARHLRHDWQGHGGDAPDAGSIAAEHLQRFAAPPTTGRPQPAILVDAYRGAMPISFQGCTGYSHLILSGAFRGAVFTETVDLVTRESPVTAFLPDSWTGAPCVRPLLFLEWMQGWLDSAEHALEESRAS